MNEVFVSPVLPAPVVEVESWTKIRVRTEVAPLTTESLAIAACLHTDVSQKAAGHRGGGLHSPEIGIAGRRRQAGKRTGEPGRPAERTAAGRGVEREVRGYRREGVGRERDEILNNGRGIKAAEIAGVRVAAGTVLILGESRGVPVIHRPTAGRRVGDAVSYDASRTCRRVKIRPTATGTIVVGRAIQHQCA